MGILKTKNKSKTGMDKESKRILPEPETDSNPRTGADDELVSHPNLTPYSEGEKVLAIHSYQTYPAKVLSVDYSEQEWRHKVHYIGWNKSWDEWVGLDRLLKINDENLAFHETLKTKSVEERKTILKLDASDKKTSSSKGEKAQKGKKRKLASANKEDGAVSLPKLVHLPIPSTLRKQLIDDHEFIMDLGKLVTLPRSPTVAEILKKYLKYKSKKGYTITDSTVQIFNGVECYFDKALPTSLLYKNERPQYEATIASDVSPSAVYGAEHLLRLFVKLPDILIHVNIAEDTLTELHQSLVDFLKYLQRNQSAFFLSTYHTKEETEADKNKQAD